MPNKPKTNFSKAVDVLKRVLSKLNVGISNGAAYRIPEEAAHTYVYCTDAKEFMLKLLGNVDIADVLLPYYTQIATLLSEPACRLVKPLEIDYNLIEVLPKGTIFNIKKKQFTNEIPEKSPRAFVKYNYEEGKDPNPTKFIEGKNLLSSLLLIFLSENT